jgi:hypothetical protein
MDNVYNRSLFSKSNRPARQKLQKMGGIMASSPELMEAAQKVGNTPNQNMGGAGSTKMANLGPPPMARPMVPPMPMPMPSSVQMPTPPVKPMGYAPGGEVEVVDITKTPTSNLNRPEFLSSFEQYLGTTPLLANKLDEAFDSREEAAAEAAKTKDAIDAAIATENTDNIVNTVLDQAGMPLNDDSKKEFARSVFGMEDVNDIDEINKRIADVAIGSSIGKGPDAFAEAVILGLGEYKKTATARAAAKSGGKSGMSPLEPFADAVRDLAGKLVAARGVDIDTAMQQAAAALAPYYGAGGGVPVASSSGPSLDERRTLVEQALKQQPDKRELILDQAAKDGVNIEGL